MDEVEFGGKNDWGKVPWTKLTSCEYQCLIDNIRYHSKPERCLWKIERFWKLGSDQQNTSNPALP